MTLLFNFRMDRIARRVRRMRRDGFDDEAIEAFVSQALGVPVEERRILV